MCLSLDKRTYVKAGQGGAETLVGGGMLAEEEEEAEWEDWQTAVRKLIPPKQFALNYFLHPIISGNTRQKVHGVP